MTTLHELLAPLALLTHAASPEQQARLSRGVLADLMGRPAPLSAQRDPVWPDLLKCLPACPSRGVERPWMGGYEEPFLQVLMPAEGMELEQSQFLRLRAEWGAEEMLLGWTVLHEDQLCLSVRPQAYREAGETVPEFLVAFQGLCRLACPPEDAQKVCQAWPSPMLLAAVTVAYEKRSALTRSPWLYVMGILHHWERSQANWTRQLEASSGPLEGPGIAHEEVPAA